MNLNQDDPDDLTEEPYTSCAFWNSKIRSIYFKRCGSCDACIDEGDAKDHARRDGD